LALEASLVMTHGEAIGDGREDFKYEGNGIFPYDFHIDNSPAPYSSAQRRGISTSRCGARRELATGLEVSTRLNRQRAAQNIFLRWWILNDHLSAIRFQLNSIHAATVIDRA